MKDHPNAPPPEEEASAETLRREKEALAEQVKMLIRAEGKLYEYQEELDAQLKEYKELYDFSRRLDAIFDLKEILRETVSYVVQSLEYERAVCFRLDREARCYRVCALDGYYEESRRRQIEELSLPQDMPALVPLLKRGEYIICNSECGSSPHARDLLEFGARLLLQDYLLYPLGSVPLPPALLVLGNSSENAIFYRKIDPSRRSLIGTGNLAGLVSSVTENRIFYEELETAREQERVAEAKYRSIFENAIEGIFQRTPEGRYLNVNPALAHMLGYGSPQSLISEVTNIRDQLYVDPLHHDELVALLHQQGSLEGFESQMYRKDGSVMWVSLSMRMVPGSAGEVLYYEGTSEEITERKQAEEDLRESEQKYRQLSQDLEKRVKEAVDEIRQKDKLLILQGRQAVMGEMISNIAHQWRQPLNMLGLLVQDLLMTQKKTGLTEEYVESSVKKSLEIIRQMSKTIDYFRYFFKPDKEKVEFRVLETIERTVAILEGSFKINGIETEFCVEGDPVTTGYPTEFIQVLLNILINARDALILRRPQSPRIRIRLFPEGGKTVLTIADNAGGVPEEIIDRIFEPYFTTKGPEQGTGIGLFMCKTIIEKNMGGRLSVTNAAEGAEFRIEI